jgi:hypothetical protein
VTDCQAAEGPPEKRVASRAGQLVCAAMPRMPPTTVRLPAPLREQIAGRAAAERRTFSGAVRVLVERGLAAADLDDAGRMEQLVLGLESRLAAVSAHEPLPRRMPILMPLGTAFAQKGYSDLSTPRRNCLFSDVSDF